MMKTERLFDGNTDRYAFDFNLCTAAKGYAQVDTSQDAWYFGTWANPLRLQIVNYCEGDLTVQEAENAAEFVAELRQVKAWNEAQGHKFHGIDPMCRPELEAAFRELGLGDLLH